jgi:hypothetical protein
MLSAFIITFSSIHVFMSKPNAPLVKILPVSEEAEPKMGGVRTVRYTAAQYGHVSLPPE